MAAHTVLNVNMSMLDIAVLACAITLAATLQASIGFGMGMVAAPVVALVAPSLLPATLILLASIVTLMTVIAERQHIDLSGTGWALAGRSVGTILGAMLVAVASQTFLSLLIAGMVLTGIALTGLGWQPTPARPALVTAGAVSGIFGTATSIGGPPMALMWQGHSGPAMRGTMSAFFLVGSLLSVGALAAAGSVDRTILAAVLALSPASVLGFFLSRHLNRLLDRRRQRILAIAVSGIGAFLLIVRELV